MAATYFVPDVLPHFLSLLFDFPVLFLASFFLLSFCFQNFRIFFVVALLVLLVFVAESTWKSGNVVRVNGIMEMSPLHIFWDLRLDGLTAYCWWMLVGRNAFFSRDFENVLLVFPRRCFKSTETHTLLDLADEKSITPSVKRQKS